MTETFVVRAQKREATKHSARDTRDQGRIPAVVYGKAVEPTPISVNYSEFLRMYRKAGTSNLVELDVEGTKHTVLVHDMMIHPVRGEIDHIDFNVVDLNAKTNVHIPIAFGGESSAIKNLGATFIKAVEAIDVRCLPKDIPQNVYVDIAPLKNNHDHICIKDLGFDADKVEVVSHNPGDVICTVTVKGGVKQTEEVEETAA